MVVGQFVQDLVCLVIPYVDLAVLVACSVLVEIF